mgnify:CR=1 FL=1
MFVLGVHYGHDTSVALLRDGEVVSAASEERFSRRKRHDARRHLWGMPQGALDAVLASPGIRAADVGLVAVPVASLREDLRRLLRDEGVSVDGAVAFVLLAAHKTWNEGKLRLFLRRAGIDAPVIRVHHHAAHAWSAWGTSSGEPATVVTLDGKGDLLSGLVGHGDGEGVRVTREFAARDSIGLAYSTVTAVLGWRMDHDEGKTNALAAHGVPTRAVREALARLSVPTGDGGWRNEALRAVRSPFRLLKTPTKRVARRLGGAIGALGRPDIAAGIQELLERRVVALVQEAMDGPGPLVVAGGVFANVSLNRRLASLPEVTSLWVHPAMGDAGLALGAALAGAARFGARPAPLKDAFLGPAPDPADVARIARSWPYRADLTNDSGSLAERVAELLDRGLTVAVCRGRMEYGPRALGHRSILRRPDDVDGAAQLNAILERDPVMPFAPVIRRVDLARCVTPPAAAHALLPFMTVAVRATPWFVRRCPAVVHKDGTSRVQVVDEDSFLSSVLGAFEARTGLPALLNTSFNEHRAPIVCTAQDAFDAWRRTGLDALVLGDRLLLR